MKILIILKLSLLSALTSFSQSIIWFEDFEAYPDGVQNTVKWTTTANNCDGDGVPGTSFNQNYWGVRTTLGDKEFCCNDIEGVTCCGNQQGQSNNTWTSQSINIFGYGNIAVQFNMRAIGGMECDICGQGNDLFVSQYQVDGGAWINFMSICGVSSGYINLECIDISGGNSLRIRMVLGNQADDEKYYFDDVFVYESTCSTILPVELMYFNGSYDEVDNRNELSWATASESNNERFEIYKSLDGYTWDLFYTQDGAGNSTSKIEYKCYDYDLTDAVAYYKLEQVDYDGKRSHGFLVAIDNTSGEETVSYIDLLGREVDDITDRNGVFIRVTQKGGEYNYETIIK